MMKAMRQLVLDPTGGGLTLQEVPLPMPARGQALVRVAWSVISTGTELSKIELAKKTLWEKARSRPDQVAKVIQSGGTDGIVATVQKVRERLGTPMPLGYSLSGVVTECGEDSGGLSAGIDVACAGTTASHAEFVVVPVTLAVPIPTGVELSDAAYTTIGAIAMHGLRTGGVQLGDRVLIIGLGLLGQLATRLCVAAGAHVFGVDPREDRAQLAVDSGAEAAQTSLDTATAQAVTAWSGGRGADIVLVTAGGADNSPLVLAGAAARDRARVVVVGAVDLTLPREPYYHKELSLVVSRSYGPGRYDPAFEERGMAYPLGFVPWTERRNMQEFLSLLEAGRVNLEGLHGASVPFERAPDGYQLLVGDAAPISVEFSYRTAELAPTEPKVSAGDVGPRESVALALRNTGASRRFEPRPLRVSMVGVGNFATSSLLPAIRSVDSAVLVRCVAGTPLKAEAVRRRWKFTAASVDAAESWSDKESEIVFIATRHDTHAAFAEGSLRANRAVFVEKPLALTAMELDRVAAACRATGARLMVGFNRRFAPAIAWALARVGPDRGNLRFLCRVNAGQLPAEHWLLDPEIGGGRLIGEACHFVDLACYFAASEPTRVFAQSREHPGGEGVPQDFAIDIQFANGSSAIIEYLSSGSPSLPKERFEIHRQGTSIVIDDFLRAEHHRAGKVSRRKWQTRDKGHHAEVHAFLDAVRRGTATPIPEEESIRSMALTLAAARSLREGRPLRQDEW
jgi:predicted dehydrogenase/threonine dehydrogenase-like Zn-dependent dehydrogenase